MISDKKKSSGKKRKPVRSIYSADGSYMKDIPPVHTVQELRDLLAKLPGNLPLELGFSDGMKPVWFNVGSNSEFFTFEENDGTWDD